MVYMGDVCAWCAWCNSLFFSMSEGLRRSCVTPGRGVAAMQVEQRVGGAGVGEGSCAEEVAYSDTRTSARPPGGGDDPRRVRPTP